MAVGETLARGGADGDLSWPLARAAELYAQAPAIRAEGQTLTYGQLWRHVAGLSGGLVALELAPGARVGFLGVNSLAHLACSMGVPAGGHVLVDLNFRLAVAELAFIADDCEIEALVVDAAQLEVARELRDRCPSLRELIYDGPDPCPADCRSYAGFVESPPVSTPPPGPEALAAISYTGGTTGRPKGVMLSHANLLANARHNLIATGHRATDRWLHVCPMFHVAGTANVLACTWVGATQIVLPRFDARAVIDTVRAEEITHTVLVPTMLGMLLDELDADPDGDRLPSLRHIQYAASPIPPALQRRVLERFDCDIAQFYGMTEAAPTVTHLSGSDHRRDDERLASVGVPVVGVQAEVRDADGSRLGPGAIGELWVRGPNVMMGYWNRPEATDAVLRDGWYRTGDAARSDADGYLYVVDRLKDVIITGGENVYSVEVEAALLEHAAVTEAAVFGIPDDRWGEAVHAVVTLAEGASVSEGELVAHCRSLIAAFKVPRSIELSDEPLPKSGAGKLLKHTLREPFWSGLERRVN